MEGAYLPGNIRQRMQELMKEHKITRHSWRPASAAPRAPSAGLSAVRLIRSAQNICSALRKCLKSPQISCWGKSTRPDRTNFDIEELGLSVQAARNLYTGKANAEIVNRLLESPRFAEVTYMIEQYFDDTLAARFRRTEPDAYYSQRHAAPKQ